MPQASEHRLGRTREPPVNVQPRVGSKLPFAPRARSKESRTPAPGPNPMLRPLPPRPGAPEERLKKLDLGRARTSGPRPRGPLRADHGVPLPGSPPPTVALPLPSRTNLARSKSVSSGDLRPTGIALGGHRGAGELGAALSRLALRPEPPALRRSASLRRLGGFPGPPTLLSIRTEPPTSHGTFHVISARPSEPFYSDDKMVRTCQQTCPPFSCPATCRAFLPSRSFPLPLPKSLPQPPTAARRLPCPLRSALSGCLRLLSMVCRFSPQGINPAIWNSPLGPQALTFPCCILSPRTLPMPD